MKKTSASLSFDSALSHEPADKRIEILRLVGRTGSISQAARDAGVSYKAAWQAIDTLTNLAGGVLVERAVGGAGGGGALLTDAGRQLLTVAGRLAESRQQALAGPAASTASAGVGYSGLRTSMRNQFPCRVDKLQGRGQMVRVHLRVADGTPLVSRITRASAELLELQPGHSVLVLCKATAVRVLAGHSPEASLAGQQLSGRVMRISRGSTGDEISLELDAGPQLVGFSAAGVKLKVKDRVLAVLDESAVVIALG